MKERGESWFLYCRGQGLFYSDFNGLSWDDGCREVYRGKYKIPEATSRGDVSVDIMKFVIIRKKERVLREEVLLLFLRGR